MQEGGLEVEIRIRHLQAAEKLSFGRLNREVIDSAMPELT